MLRPSGQVKSNFYSTMPCYLLFRQPISNVKKDISITETCLFFHVNLGEEANTTITGHNTTDDAQPNVRESGKRENEANLQPIRKPCRPGEDSCPVLLESGIFAGHRHLCVILTDLSSTWTFKTVLEEKQDRVALPRGQNQIETVENV